MGVLNNKKGIALITVLLLLVVVGVLTSALMVMYTSNMRRAGNAAKRNQAFYAAEAGANYLNEHINKNAKEKNIVFQPIMEAELRNLTGDLTNEFFNEFDSFDSEDFNDPIFKYNLKEDLEINDFDLHFTFDEDTLNRQDEIYGFIIEASDGRISERIRLIYEIQTLPPFFRSSRQASRININNSSFGSSSRFPAHSFATAEIYYDEWESNNNYKKGDIVYHNGNHYKANTDHETDNYWGQTSDNWDFIEEAPDLREYGQLDNSVDYGMDVLPPQPPDESWSRSDDYLEGDKVRNIVDGEEKFFISYVDNPETEPGVGENWESDWNEYHNYKKQVVEAFDDLINNYGGRIYTDNVNYDYELYDYSKNYNEGDVVLSGGRFYRLERERRGLDWNIIDRNPDLGYRKFLNDNLYSVGPYIKIDGDFTPTESFYKNLSNMKSDESGVVHILVDGDINFTTSSNVNLYGNQNVIMYVNGDLNFDPGFINIGSFNGQLAYFAPNATFTFKDQSGIGFGSSMVVNELNIINSYIREVSYDTESSPLIGKMNPKIAELSRSFATQHGGGTVSQINPVRQSWERLK